METKNRPVFTVICCALTALLGFSQVQAGPTYGGWQKTAVGVRLGWSGAPNGLTLRRNFLPGQAFEVVAGYNGKVGRHADNLPGYRKGNTFVGASYAPCLEMGDSDFEVAVMADLGARMRYHHYRPFRFDDAGWKITPDFIAGVGMQVEFSEKVQIFADLHLNYFNRNDNVYVPGVESGMGMRFVLN